MRDHSNTFTTMKNSCLLLLVVMMMAEALGNNSKANKRDKRDLLLRFKRRWVLSTFELVEEDNGPFPKNLTTMFNNATNKDKHEFHISGTGVTLDPKGVFRINKRTGLVEILKKIDREEHSIFHIKFDIRNSDTGLNIDDTLSFDVAIMDLNDNKPVFKKPVTSVSVKESTPEGWLPVWLEVTDDDEKNTINSTVTIKILSQEPKEPVLKLDYASNPNVPQLSFEGCFDYTKANKYKIIVEAKDGGKPALSSTAVINVDITDSNSHRPTFKERKYEGEIMEMETNMEVLRVGVEDKDTPNTPGWNAKYFFISGNEDKNYEITTDPKTNEGILMVIKGRDFERTTAKTLQIGVKNEEELFVCTSKKGGSTDASPPMDSVNIIVNVIDVNDPPIFSKTVTEVYQKEEDEPGQKLFEPKITDEDSEIANIRYKILEDRAGWARIDTKTGIVHTAKKMDRESPFVNGSIYKIVVAAIDDGKPPATASGTILVHLRDINDNLPWLVNNSVVMCTNKVNKVMVLASDKDIPPFSGPFAFSLGGGDEALKQTWKIDPANGEEAGLVALKSLPYGNYSVQLAIQDQQGMKGEDMVVVVVVCDCGGGDTCRGKLPRLSNISPSTIGLIFAALLLLLLLLLLTFTCECGKEFITVVQSEGNQSLIMYNEEGGGSACKTEPTFHLTSISSRTVTDGQKLDRALMSQMSQRYEITPKEDNFYQSSAPRLMNSIRSQKQGQQRAVAPAEPRESLRSQGSQNMSSTWNSNRMMSTRNGSRRVEQTSTLLSDQLIAEHIDCKVYELGEGPGGYPLDHPTEFTYEGEGSRSQSLDKLSLDLGDDLGFLNDLGPKFKTLGGLCHQNLKEKNIQL